jgi:hypothetical protein
VSAVEATGRAGPAAVAGPAHRDRTVDALRAVAILGVVLGHWLVSAVVSDPAQPAALHGASPLATSPGLAPVTWFLETLGPFFFAGGFAATAAAARRAVGPAAGGDVATAAAGRRPVESVAGGDAAVRLLRLLRPLLPPALVWVPAILLLRAVGAPAGTRHVLVSLVSHPLWFVLVYLVLSAAAPALRRLVARFGVRTVVLPAVALVAVVDLVRPYGLPTWLALPAVPVAWAVPYVLGIALAQGTLPRRAGAALLGLGVLGGAALVLLAGYPASAVGVPGDHWSNLDPPSLFALALAAAQLGAFLLLRPRLAGLLRRPAAWAPVGLLNRNAMTVFCWHQSALLLVTFAGLLAGRPAGLLDDPGPGWPWHRLVWLPCFLLTLGVLVSVFHRAEGRRGPAPRVPR